MNLDTIEKVKSLNIFFCELHKCLYGMEAFLEGAKMGGTIRQGGGLPDTEETISIMKEQIYNAYRLKNLIRLMLEHTAQEHDMSYTELKLYNNIIKSLSIFSIRNETFMKLLSKYISKNDKLDHNKFFGDLVNYYSYTYRELCKEFYQECNNN